MASVGALKIGVYVPGGAQLLDLSPIDLFAMMSPEYLAACMLPAPLVALGMPSIIHYIGLPETGTHLELTASAFLKVSKTTKDAEVQPGLLDIILVPGPNPSSIFGEDALDFLRAHATWRGDDGEGVDILCVCTGAYMLGQSGILKGKNASGPRALVPGLKKKFPDVNWVDDKRWVKDGNIWTSGGITNGQEMVAAYIREKFPGPAAEATLEMAGVGDKGIEYNRAKSGDALWWLWQILKAITVGKRSVKRKGL
ncbi:PfpI endopeptidase-like protein [Rhexocercosporidium sp. MPI-PUGE-AT-0058]|nr:PfpI endopeptidase-like protein [Rhexocercosporidium sp. MPI-PUGE-AT-0058]